MEQGEACMWVGGWVGRDGPQVALKNQNDQNQSEKENKDKKLKKKKRSATHQTQKRKWERRNVSACMNFNRARDVYLRAFLPLSSFHRKGDSVAWYSWSFVRGANTPTLSSLPHQASSPQILAPHTAPLHQFRVTAHLTLAPRVDLWGAVATTLEW